MTPEPTPALDPLIPIFAEFDPSHFSNGATITNEWLPLQPGRRWIEDGVTLEGGERIPHRITFTVTNLTKVIAGVKTAVVWVEDLQRRPVGRSGDRVLRAGRRRDRLVLR